MKRAMKPAMRRSAAVLLGIALGAGFPSVEALSGQTGVAGDSASVMTAADSILAAAALAAMADSVPERVPTMPPPGRWGAFDFPAPRFQGRASMITDLYHAGGIDPRRPTTMWRLILDPSMTLPGDITMGVDVLVSTEDVRVDRHISRLGLSPRWSWGALHLGDFTRDYGRYTVEGLRVRGVGLDVEGRGVRASIQTGRAQRMVMGGFGEPVFRRNLVAATVGVGNTQRSHLDFQLLSVRDDPTREEVELIAGDTILTDTIHVDLLPEAHLGPQENLVMGIEGQLSLLDRFLTLRVQAATTLYTRDLFAEPVNRSETALRFPGSVLDVVEGRHPVRLSSSTDHAWQGEVRLRRGAHGLRMGFEEVGAGYTSLGLPYVANDRRSWNLAGNTALMEGRVALQAQHRAQTNNLLGQLRNTVDRGTTSVGVAWRITDEFSVNWNGVVADTRNDATEESQILDNRALSLSVNSTLQTEIMGLASMMALAYSFQQTRDGGPMAFIPSVTTHSVAPSVQVTFSPDFNVAPQVSYNLTSGDGMETQRDLLVGARGSARFRDGALRTTANLTQTISQGRQVMAAQLQGSFPLTWDAEASVQLRYSRYAAFAERPGFQESFMTFSVARTF